jgi:oxygen-independent coproporphyrinogen III oxidase
MWPYHPDLLARPVPRYTSFPTAAEFHDGGGSGAWEAALDASIREAATPVSLYIHIPYCHEICWYCGCNTGMAGRRARLTAYLDALGDEIALLAARLPSKARIDHIAFGGGSPNAIAPVDFIRLIDRLYTGLPMGNPVLSVELDPRGINAEWAAVLGSCGVQRASLGVQSFDPVVQAAIGRVQPQDDIVRAVDALRSAGVASVNFDLMYGLPHQDQASLDASLAATASLRPDRIALFGYAHVPHLIPRQRRIDGSALANTETRFGMAQYGHAALVAAGYAPVGFDHFALPGDPLAVASADHRLRRNFQGFTDDDAACMIGLGASAISLFPDHIIQNEKNAGRYRMRLSQARLTGTLGVARSAEDRARGAVIEAILCHRPVDARRFPAELATLDLFAERGLVERGGGIIRPVEASRPYARAMAALFDPYRAATGQRFSNAI